MRNNRKRYVDNDLTTDELLSRVRIEKTVPSDIGAVSKMMFKEFHIDSCAEARFELIDTNANFNESVKVVDPETGDIYGALIFSDYPLEETTTALDEEITKLIENHPQVNGFVFLLDERLRGTGIDRKMLTYNLGFIKENYDIIWCGVAKYLHSGDYWKRNGFKEICEDEDSTFYMLLIDENFSMRYLYEMDV